LIRVVDASVALRWFVDAPGTDAALQLLEGEEALIAPDLIVVEVANAAWKLARAGEISEEHGARVAGAVASSFSELVPSGRLIVRAYALAGALEHPVYDCVYLALAEREEARLVTADQRLLGRLGNTSLGHLALPL
jgi:predicted nucleic acid-binding protein